MLFFIHVSDDGHAYYDKAMTIEQLKQKKQHYVQQITQAGKELDGGMHTFGDKKDLTYSDLQKQDPYFVDFELVKSIEDMILHLHNK